jgi:anti-anti-sigma factor
MMTSTLHVELDPGDDGPVLRLRGDLDASTVPDLWRRIDDLDAATSTTVLDLADLDFVDSSGIGLLFRLQQRVADHGGMVVARGPSPKVRRLLEMTQLNRVIAILD